MVTSRRHLWGICFCCIVALGYFLPALPCPAANVVLNEIVTSTSDYHLTWDEAAVPHLGSGPDWYTPEYDASGWQQGLGPFGLGYPGLGTELGAPLKTTPSLYLRYEFELPADWTPGAGNLELHVAYDDGFVAYLNGKEVARRNMGPPGLFVHAEQSAFNAVTDAVEEVIEIPLAQTPLVAGRNLLAIQVHKTQPGYEQFNPPLNPDGTMLLDITVEVAGLTSAVVRSADLWSYYVGQTEPARGLLDMTLTPTPDTETPSADWIELHNAGSTSVSLAGWRLTDDPEDNQKWFFPNATLPPEGYLVVFCSGLDRRDPAVGPLHTNFKLEEEGEYLGLFNERGELVDQFAQAYPRIPASFSFGRDPEAGAWVFFSVPTPRGANRSPIFVAIVEQPQASLPPGFYDQDCPVVLTCSTLDATIRYTYDGTEPTATNGFTYTGPLWFHSNVTLRARGIRPGWIPSPVLTATYLIREPPELQSLPALSIVADPRRALFAPEGVLTIRGGRYSSECSDCWEPLSPDDYNMAMMQGDSFERPASVEFMIPYLDGGYAQMDCGLRFAGSRWSRPRMWLTDLEHGMWNNGPTNKPSFRLFFRHDYGAETLDQPLFPGSSVRSFQNLRLRAGKNDWLNPFVTDETVRRLSLAMGQVTSHGILCNLYVNGEYRSHYNLVEALREPAFQAWYRTTNLWDIITVNEIVAGDASRWTKDIDFVRTNSLADPVQYAAAAQRFDLVNLADYLLLNSYCATHDWPENNFYVARERSPSGQWRFYVWDAEYAFGPWGIHSIDYNTITNDLLKPVDPGTWATQVIPLLFQALYANREFRLLFADRFQKHCFGEGVLTATNVMATFAELKAQLDPTLLLTTGRGVIDVFVKNWTQERLPYLLAQLREADLFPATPAPRFSPPPGLITPGTSVSLSTSNGTARIYYTTDGTDPRAPGGAPAGWEMTAPLPLVSSTVIKARVLDGAEWSPLVEANYRIPTPDGLVISEINFDPPDVGTTSGQRFEFIEIHNTRSETAPLTGVGFSAGVDFTFPLGAVLGPKAYAVVVADPVAFSDRYPGVPIAGVIASGRLDNQGERITLAYWETNILFSVRYDNQPPWPAAATGGGATLVPSGSSATHPDDPLYWRASSAPGGSPGEPDLSPSAPPLEIHEIIPRPSVAGEWRIELHNPTATAVSLEGWCLSDDPGVPSKYRFSAGSMLAPDGFLVLNRQWFSSLPTSNRISLHPGGGHLVLSVVNSPTVTAAYSTELEYGIVEIDASLGRHVNSGGEVQFPVLSAATLGGPNAPPLVGPVIINEIMYRPSTGNAEFLELLNVSNDPVSLFDLSAPNRTWQIDGVGFHFPPNIILAPGELVLVTATDPAFFRTQNDVPSDVRIFGPWAGQLQDDGEYVRLQKPELLSSNELVLVTMDEVRYGTQPPWPVAAARARASLQRISPDAYGNDPASWAAVGLSPGRPNLQTPEIVLTAPASGSWGIFGEPLQLTADVASTVGPVARIDFYADARKVAESTSGSLTCAWLPSAVGTHRLSAVAVAQSSLTWTSAAVTVQVLAAASNLVTIVPSNAVWKYWDRGIDLLEAWHIVGYDDRGWAEGPAELGYGDAVDGRPEATTVSYGPDAKNKYLTTYFRRTFNLDPGAMPVGGSCSVLVDDGARAFLNGNKIVHYNLPSVVTYRARASSVSPENTWMTYNVPASYFRAGVNELAVEVHQAAPNSDDLSFALQIVGAQRVVKPWIACSPRGSVVEAGQDVELAVTAAGTQLDYQWHRAGRGRLEGANRPTLTLASVQPEQAGGYYVIVTNTLGASTSAVANVTVLLPDLAGDVAINEIMYHPSSEKAGEEYIELLNLRPLPVSLAGWQLTDGVSFVFPNLVLAPGDMCVVAANVASFRAKYPSVTNVVGGWTGSLRNSNERIRLEDSLGRTIDTVAYADEGDWATRVRGPLDYGTRGWEWESGADGLGRSLELINPRLPHERGQNWASSAPLQGTPGRPNSVASTNVAPLILDVAHSPLVPKPNDRVAITARLVDESASGLSAVLHHRDHSSTNPGPFIAIPMLDDGQHGDGLAADGLYGIEIGPDPAGTVVEFYVSARDADGRERTWPAPALNTSRTPVQEANALYQVDENGYAGAQPMMRLILTGTERHLFETIDPISNAQMNATVVSEDDIVTEARYNAGVRVRGGSTRTMPVLGMRVHFPSDRRWESVTGVDLISYFAHDQVIGSMVTFKAGLINATVRAAQVRLNGANLAQPGPPNAVDGSGFGSYALREVTDSDWAEHHFPKDAEGNVYLCRRPNTDLAYLGTNWQTYAGWGYEKNTQEDENDWSDLIHLTDVLNNAPSNTYSSSVRQALDPEEWASYFALNAILGNNESSLATGIGDDYNLYRGVIDSRMLLIPHDWDTILGQAGSLPVNADLFLPTTLPAINRFLKHPDFVPLYYAELQRLINTVCSPAQLHPLLDQFLGSYVDAATLNSMKAYVTARSAFIRSQIPLSVTVTSALPVVRGFFKTTVPTVAVWGQANVLNTRAVRVNGQPATWSAWNGRWTNAAVALLPGLNDIRVQSFDAQGTLRDEASAAVWYDDGTEVVIPGGTLNADTTWTPAAGPYSVTDTFTIPAGRTLTIAPGTTVFMVPQVAIRVEGRVVVEGTEAQPIRIGTRPGTIGYLLGFFFYNNTGTNRIAHAIFDEGGYAVRAYDSNVQVEDVIFRRGYGGIYTTNSSLLVRRCLFPTMPGAETIGGIGMPTNGYCIIENNVFGGTTGYSDIIDWTGGKRPGPIFEAYNNVFLAGSDDGLDLDGTDAHIEGNTFMHFHRDAPRESISCGIATDVYSDVVAVRNVFYDCDNAVLLKNGAWLTAENNTFVGCLESVIDFGTTNRLIHPGAGAQFAGNISWNNPSTFERYYVPGYSDVNLTVAQSIIQGTNWPGVGNLDCDPLLVDLTNDFRLLPGSPALGAGPNGLDMGAFVPGGASISGEPPAITPSDSAVLTIAGPGITHYRYRVNSGAFSAGELTVATPILLTNLTNGPYLVEVIGKNSAGRWQDVQAPTHSKPWTVDLGLRRLVLNEVLARNVGAYNHFGTWPDLIELHNAGAVAYDLSGIQLSDDPEVPGKFVFPTGTTLAAGEYLVLLANDPDGTPGWHLGFALDRSGDRVCLFEPEANGGALLDAVVFGLQLPDYSLGRQRDGSWALMQPTFGGPNRPVPTGSPARLRITEWLAKGTGDDFIELHNPLPVPIALGGLHLTDHPGTWPDRHTIAPLSYIGPGEYAVFIADGQTDQGASHLSFALDYHQGSIGLFSQERLLLDSIVYGPQRLGISQGRLAPDADQMVSYLRPSPGSANVTNQAPAISLISPAEGEMVPLPGDIRLIADATDPDGSIVKVEFYLDLIKLGEVSRSPYTLVWSNVPPGTYTFRARATDNAGESVFSQPVTINQGPGSVALLAPAESVWPASLPLTLEAAVVSPTLSARVEFYAENLKLGEATERPYRLIWTPQNLGPVTLSALAFPGVGPSITSAPVSLRVLRSAFVRQFLIATNADWKYLDAGVDAGTHGWPVAVDDQDWRSGPAQLGYGEGDEATVVSFGADPNNKYPTTYFHTRFNVDHAAWWRNLRADILVDDGAVFYLNGTEALRFGMPAGPIAYSTFAVTNSPEVWLSFPVASPLADGTNRLAAEVHQGQPASSDLSFALALSGERALVEPWLVQAPASQTVEAGSNAVFQAAVGGTSLAYQWYGPEGTPLPGGNAALLQLTNVGSADAGAYHLVVTNSLGSLTSAVVVLTVLFPDRDGDGMPDYWEVLHHLNPLDPSDASADIDGDGIINRREYVLNTNPEMRDLFASVRLLSGSTPAAMNLRFTAEAQTAHVVEYSTELRPLAWQTFSNIAPQSTTRFIDVTVPCSERNRIYRIRRVP